MGAHLEAGERTLRLTAPPDLAAEYAALRRDYLEPHAPMVRLLLEQARCSLADAEN
jgi:type IV secretory pathway protease TraF